MSKKKKEKRKTRAEPQGTSWLISDEAYSTLCCAGYTRLSDNPEIQAAVNKICDLISSMTIYLMENTDSGDVRIHDGISKKVDIDPNPYMTRKTFISAIVRTLLLEGDGNCAVIPKTVDGYLQSLLPVPPSRVGYIENGNGYNILIDGQPHDPSELLHFVINPSPEHPYFGTGYRVTLKDIANNLKQAAKTKKGFLESKWKPPVIVKVDANSDEMASPSGRKNILKDYIETTEAGEPWVIPAEQFDVISVKPLSLNDLALVDGVTLDKKSVAAILDVPSFIVGAGEFSEKEWNNFVNTRIRPLCNALEQELTKKILLSPLRYFKFNARSLYSYDIEKLANVGANLYTRGIMTGNEVRDWTDQSPRDGLDELIILENYIPKGMIGDQKKLNKEEGE